MSPGHTSERVYKVLKLQIMTGERRAGERLDPARLAQELNASSTPVRDALHQLLGERMVQAIPQQGFLVPVPSETGLRDLYGWTADLLSILLRGWRGDAGAAAVHDRGDGDVADATAALLDAIARTLGTSEHLRAVRDASDRLHWIRTIEPAIVADAGSEIDTLIELWTRQSASELRQALRHYHRKRIRAVPAIIALAIRAHA